MPRIPQYDAERGIGTPPSSAESSPLAFGMPHTALMQGAHELGQGLTDLANVNRAITKRRQHENDMRWVHASLTRESKVLTDYMVDPKNNSTEDYSDKFYAYAMDRVAEYEQAAPSKRAADVYRASIMAHISRLHSQAAQTTEGTRLDNTRLAVSDQISDAMGAYRNELSAPNGQPVQSLHRSHDLISSYIDKVFGKVAPANAKKLRAHLDSEMAIGAMQDHPAYSKFIIETSKDLDERDRKVLMGHLEQSMRSMNIVQQDQFNRMRQDWLVSVQTGKQHDKIPLDQYRLFFDDDHAQVQKAHDDEWVDAYNQANDLLNTIGPMEASAQSRALQKITEDERDLRGQRVAQIVADHVRENLKLQDNDRVSWLDKFNPDVMEINKRMANAPTDQAREQLRPIRNQILLKYQGYPPQVAFAPDSSGLISPGNIDLINRPRVKNEDGSISTVRSMGVNIDNQEVLIPTVSDSGKIMSDKEAIDEYIKTGRHLGKFNSVAASNKYAEELHKYQESLINENANYYLRLPSNDRHLMSTGEAQASANDINKGEPKEAIGRIDQVINRYGEHAMIALNDMVSLPGERGIRQDYQLAFLNRDAWWLDTYIGAISHDKSLSKLDETKRSDMERSMDSHPIWQQFKRAMIGDNFSRSDEIAGFRTGIQALTHALVDSGMPLKQATETSVRRLISEQLGFPRVNGQVLAISRSRETPGIAGPHLPNRTDADMTEIGRGLELSLQQIDPREINQSNFPFLKNMGTEFGKLQALRDQITSRGFFVTGNDGQTTSLYFHDDNGMNFQVTDKKHQPFQIHVEDLPQFKNLPGAFPGMTTSRVTTEGTVDRGRLTGKTRDIGVERYWQSATPQGGGSYQSRTNWPTMGSQFRRGQQMTPATVPTDSNSRAKWSGEQERIKKLLEDVQAQENEPDNRDNEPDEVDIPGTYK